MIIKGNARSGALDLARHLMNGRDNDHVELYGIRHLMSETVVSAFREMEAQAKGTRCTNFLYSVSINPPDAGQADFQVYEKALEKIEASLGLSDVARVVVFHEKEGRRHAHAVYCRIQENGKAVQLAWDRPKLMKAARELCLEYGWTIPKGIESYVTKAFEKVSPANSKERYEKEQVKRTGTDTELHKAFLTKAVAGCKDLSALQNQLQSNGYYLCRGNRDFAVWDVHAQEVYSLARLSGQKMNALKEKYASYESLPSLEAVKKQAVESFHKNHQKQKDVLDMEAHRFKKNKAAYDEKLLALRDKQKQEREKFRLKQEANNRQFQYQTKNRRESPERYESLSANLRKRNQQKEQSLISRHIDERKALDKACQAWKMTEVRLYGQAKGRLSLEERQLLARQLRSESTKTRQTVKNLLREHYVVLSNTLGDRHSEKLMSLSKLRNLDRKQFWDTVRKGHFQLHLKDKAGQDSLDKVQSLAQQQFRDGMQEKRVGVSGQLLSTVFKSRKMDATQAEYSQFRWAKRYKEVSEAEKALRLKHKADESSLLQAQKTERSVLGKNESEGRHADAIARRENYLQRGVGTASFNKTVRKAPVDEGVVNKPNNQPVKPVDKDKRGFEH